MTATAASSAMGTSLAPSSLCPFFRKAKPSKHFVYPVSCKVPNVDPENHSRVNKDIQKAINLRMCDRRKLLVSLGGLYAAAATLRNDPFSLAASISSPDLTEPSIDCLPNDEAQATETLEEMEFPFLLDSIVSIAVDRPKKSRSKEEKEEAQEVLVIEGFEYMNDRAVGFLVYVNEEEEDIQNPSIYTEIAGSFVSIYSTGKKKKKTGSLDVPISDLLEELGAEDDDYLVVTLKPTFGKGNVTIRNIRIELQRYDEY